MPAMAKRPPYLLLLTVLTGFGLMLSSLWWSRIPLQGLMQAESSEPAAFRAVYYGLRGAEQVSAGQPDGTLTIAPLRAVSEQLGPVPTLLPVYDGSVTAQAFADAYPSLPAEALPGFGKTVYAVEYANVRLLLLNASRMTEASSAAAQWNWARDASLSPGKAMNLLVVDQLPEEAFLWDRLNASAVDAVLAGSDVYIRRSSLMQETEGIMSVPSAVEWKRWTPAKQFPEAVQLLLEGTSGQLRVKAVSRKGADLGYVVLDSSPYEKQELAALPPVTLIPQQSLWFYRAGGEDLPVFIPEGFDMHGEHPSTGAANVPAGDWRSPDFPDAGWQLDRAPFGQHRDPLLKRQLRTQLPLPAEPPAYYFRKSFEFTGKPEELAAMSLLVSYEDGFAAYLNGEELARGSLSTGLLTPQKLAEPNEAVLYKAFDLTSRMDKLRSGRNVLAVEVHRSHPKAPNLLFDAVLTVQYKGGVQP
jgi:hypothetical protein